MRSRILLVTLIICLISVGVAQALIGSISTNVRTDGRCEGAFFNVTAHNNAVQITGFETNLVGTANVRVYYRQGGYQGAETNAGAWTLLGSQTLTGGTGTNQTLFPLNVGGLTIPAGQTYGFLIYSGYASSAGSDDIATRYLVLDPPATRSYSNADVTLYAGAASCSNNTTDNDPFNGFYEGRIWHGTVYYGDPPPVGQISDGRINRFDLAAPFAAYAHQDAVGQPGLIFYDTYADSPALLVVGSDQIAAVPEFPAVNTLIAASPDGRVALYRLTDGQFQAMGPMQDSGKTYGLIFPSINASVDYDSFEEG